MSHCFDFMWMCRTTCFTTRPQLIKANGVRHLCRMTEWAVCIWDVQCIVGQPSADNNSWPSVTDDAVRNDTSLTTVIHTDTSRTDSAWFSLVRATVRIKYLPDCIRHVQHNASYHTSRLEIYYTRAMCEWVSSFLTARQHKSIDHSVPSSG